MIYTRENAILNDFPLEIKWDLQIYEPNEWIRVVLGTGNGWVISDYFYLPEYEENHRFSSLLRESYFNYHWKPKWLKYPVKNRWPELLPKFEKKLQNAKDLGMMTHWFGMDFELHSDYSKTKPLHETKRWLKEYPDYLRRRP
jgi:hypothetical protein